MSSSTRKPSVNTGRVQGRRTLCYASYADLITDARQLASGPVRTLGNWNYAQIIKHIAAAIDMATRGSPATASWWIRMAAPLLKRRFLTQPMPAGFKFPERFRPGFEGQPEQPVAEALQQLLDAVARIESRGPSYPHPIFGNMTAEEWKQLMLRHAEMHMSFAVPVERGME